jgi:membrane protease YdiL (CAAX protease family)
MEDSSADEKDRKKVQILFSFLTVLTFFIPYCVGWSWKFAPGTVLVVCFGATAYPKSWKTKFGLQLDKSDLVKTIVFTLSFSVLSHFIIQWILSKSGLECRSSTDWMWRVSPIFQAFNEEMILRAWLLGTLLHRFKSAQFVSVASALFFSLLHGFLYRYSMEGVVVLHPLTLLNLTLFGIICNSLYFSYNHIGFGAALHIGWNLTRFSGPILNHGHQLLEGETFNLIEGSWLISALLVSLLSCLVLRRYIHKQLLPNRPLTQT